jgi:hypothetical protein
MTSSIGRRERPGTATLVSATMGLTLRAFQCVLNIMMERVTRSDAWRGSGPLIASAGKYYASGLVRSGLGNTSSLHVHGGEDLFQMQRRRSRCGLKAKAPSGSLSAEGETHRTHEQMRWSGRMAL